MSAGIGMSRRLAVNAQAWMRATLMKTRLMSSASSSTSSSGMSARADVSAECAWPVSYRGVRASDIAQLDNACGRMGVAVYGREAFETGVFRDWTGAYGMQPRITSSEAEDAYEGAAVAFPRSTREVAAVLEYCNRERVAVVPQGGNTGLVGGGVPGRDGSELVLSLRKMCDAPHVDEDSGVATCEAGVILQSLNDVALAKGWMVPLDLGAKGSCTIGGNVSTNAGGIRLLRYGSLHGSVLGVEAVLADGRVVDVLNTNRKDNTGVDLKHLFIGSEGVLGIITKIAIQLAPRPNAVNAMWLRVRADDVLASSSSSKGFGSVLRVLRLARERLGGVLSAFELVDAAALRLVLPTLQPSTSAIFDTEGVDGSSGGEEFNILIETHGDDAEQDSEKLMAFVEHVMEEGLVPDDDGSILAQSQTQLDALWSVREGITDALSSGARESGGKVFKYDLSIPVRHLYDLVAETRVRIDTHAPDLYDVRYDDCGPDAAGARVGANKVTVVGYGHMGDGNLHLNVLVKSNNAEDVDRVKHILEPFVYDWTSERGGSVSAEHGIGVLKSAYLGLSKSQQSIALMAQTKAMMDPRCILNPRKVIPPEYIIDAYRHQSAIAAA